MNPATTSSHSSAQGYADDPRNDDVVVYVDGEFVPRDRAVVSVFDSGFVLEDESILALEPEYEVLATNDLGDGENFTTPAVSGGRIFIKGKSYLWCIGTK